MTAAAVATVFAANAAPAAAAAMGGSFVLRLTVPVACRVSYTAGGAAAVGVTGGAANDQAGAFDLGQIGEYCNDGAGYSVVVDYAPGTLKGAVLQLGSDRVVLDGSGEATISQSQEARIRQRELLATPGANGFDSPELSFQIKAD